MKGRVIFAVGSCGGSGNSFFTCSVSAALAIQSNRKCLIVDCVKGFTFTEYVLGSDREATSTFDDFLSGICDLEEIILKTEIDNLSILPSSEDIEQVSDFTRMGNTLNILSKCYDYVFVDVPSFDALKIMSKFPENYSVIINMELVPYSVMNAQLLADSAAKLGSSAVGFVVNKFDRHLYSQNKIYDDIDAVIDLIQAPLLGIIPYDEEIPKLLCQDINMKNILKEVASLHLKNSESSFSAARRIALRLEGYENIVAHF